jgi:hypothetical protein
MTIRDLMTGVLIRGDCGKNVMLSSLMYMMPVLSMIIIHCFLSAGLNVAASNLCIRCNQRYGSVHHVRSDSGSPA